MLNRPRTIVLFLWALGLSQGLPAAVRAAGGATETVRGVVFEDGNANGARDPGERGLPRIGVSNGRDIVETDGAGRYELALDDDDIVFVIKPRDFMVPVDALNIPRFYYIHKPAGSPTHLAYAGVPPTGPLPASVDFALTPRPEPQRFEVFLLGDPQPRDIREVNYLAHDVVADLVGSDAAFAVLLGDVAYDDLSVFEPLNLVMSTVGAPIVAVHGNHDMNYDVDSDELADETWERVYGPGTWSFDWGPAHFIVLDNVHFEDSDSYHAEIGRHLTYIENDLRRVPQDALVVVMMHIPIVDAVDRAALYALLADRPHTLSLSAHWHLQRHYFLGATDGWPGAEPHHHLVHATACGAWWEGGIDEQGIPHATMRDGAPNGHSILTIEGSSYRIRFKPARRPEREQMSIWVPSKVPLNQLGATEVLANVYAGSERSTVAMRVVGHSNWKPMQRVDRIDPYIGAIKFREASMTPPDGRRMPDPIICPHMWRSILPVNLPPGAHVVEVRTRDMFGHVDQGHRIVRVEVAPY